LAVCLVIGAAVLASGCARSFTLPGLPFLTDRNASSETSPPPPASSSAPRQNLGKAAPPRRESDAAEKFVKFEPPPRRASEPATAAKPAGAAPQLKRDAPASGTKPAVAANTAGRRVIEIGAGDTLYGLSKRYGVPVASIMAANSMTSSNLTSGAKIIIPEK
jgi:hypothetical protein